MALCVIDVKRKRESGRHRHEDSYQTTEINTKSCLARSPLLRQKSYSRQARTGPALRDFVRKLSSAAEGASVVLPTKIG